MIKKMEGCCVIQTLGEITNKDSEDIEQLKTKIPGNISSKKYEIL